MSAENKKYYLGLIFEREMGDGLHCTHCYFGTLNQQNLQAVQLITTRFFETWHIRLRKVRFDVRALFGPERDIRVLLTSDVEAFEPLRGLRHHFEASGLMGKVDYPFRPHVTTELPLVDKPFHSYVLVESGVIIKRWPILQNYSSPEGNLASEFHACKTGDCSHETQAECDKTLAEECACPTWPCIECGKTGP